MMSLKLYYSSIYQRVMVLTCIQEGVISNLCRENDSPEVCRCFPKFLQINVGIAF
jgi:hypothetical protein